MSSSQRAELNESSGIRRRTGQIQIRDPYVLPVAAAGVYYMFGSTDANIWSGQAIGFDAYRSTDLEHWQGPFPVFRPRAGFWSQTNYWAPEVHEYQGRYYMLATFGAGEYIDRRGTAVLSADSPLGPFLVHSTDSHGRPAPVTPAGWECLDGTLYLDSAGQPWMVFCHEWVQISDGTVCAVRLSPDLRRAEGEPVVLFSASQAPWAEAVESPRHGRGWVTDGPFLHRTAQGSLLMLWSSFRHGRYAQGLAISATGEITGPWRHEPQPLFAADGGHGMIFRRFDHSGGPGSLMLTLHSPNRTPRERAQFIELQETADSLQVVGAAAPDVVT